jgi:hypothetical protein
MADEEATAPTIPAPAAVLVEDAAIGIPSSLAPPPGSGERACAAAGYTLPWLQKSG